MDCIFCKIASGEIPSKKVFENDDIVAFRDIEPMAPVHIVIIPKKHIASSAMDINSENASVIAEIFKVIPTIAAAEGIDKDGFRIVNNCGDNAGQTVKHIHFHLLGGKKLNNGLA